MSGDVKIARNHKNYHLALVLFSINAHNLFWINQKRVYLDTLTNFATTSKAVHRLDKQKPFPICEINLEIWLTWITSETKTTPFNSKGWAGAGGENRTLDLSHTKGTLYH